MSLDYRDTELCFCLAAKEYANGTYESAEDLANKAISLMTNDIEKGDEILAAG